MLPPVVCLSCGMPLGDIAPAFRRALLRLADERTPMRGGVDARAAPMGTAGAPIEAHGPILHPGRDLRPLFDAFGIEHDCCRAHLCNYCDFRELY
jgi:DNA-directed RNA polymerase subunit N (RpoN/RPB10)